MVKKLPRNGVLTRYDFILFNSFAIFIFFYKKYFFIPIFLSSHFLL
jgi:hypothetical protein